MSPRHDLGGREDVLDEEHCGGPPGMPCTAGGPQAGRGHRASARRTAVPGLRGGRVEGALLRPLQALDQAYRILSPSRSPPARVRIEAARPHRPRSDKALVRCRQARAAALEILALAKKGIDPRHGDAKRTAEPVMADLGKRFLEDYVPVHCKPRTREEYRRSVTLFIDPAIGEMPIAEVQRKDIAELHHGPRRSCAGSRLRCGTGCRTRPCDCRR